MSRWCFYINLPIGAVTFAVIFFILHLPEPKREKLTWKQRVNRLDPLGTLVFLPSIVCLLLALQWGGVTYAWSSGRIIALLVLFGVLIIAFIAIQIWRQENATVPPRIIRNRSILAGIWFIFCIGTAMFIYIYFLPIWFQAIKRASAVKSGIMTLPFILGVVIASSMSGFLTKKIGYYTGWMYFAAVLMPIGSGLITTFTPHTPHAKWIGYQFIFGFGMGFGMQQPNVAAQVVLARKDVATGGSLMFFSQTLGGSIFSSVCNNIFDNALAKGLARVPGLDLSSVVDAGATSLVKLVPADKLPQVREVYNHALVDAFQVALVLSCLACLGAAGMEWKSVKKSQNSTGQGKQPPQQEAKKETDVEKGEAEAKVENKPSESEEEAKA